MTVHRTKGVKQAPVVPLRGAWTAIPNDLLRDTSLTPAQRMLGALLYVYAGNQLECWPLQDELAQQLGVERRTIRSWLRILETKRYLVTRHTMYGNRYVLQEPLKHMSDRIPGSDPNRIPGSAQGIPGSDPNRIPGSDPSLSKEDSCVKTHETPCPPTTLAGDDSTHDSIRSEDTPTITLLKKVGINAWKELATKLANVPYPLIERRVNKLIDEGKNAGIIVTSLRNIPFTPGALDEAGPLPMNREFWAKYGMTFGDDEDEQIPDLDDPEVAKFAKECFDDTRN